MYQLSPYRYQRRLLVKTEETVCEARLVNERLTSKTCTRCRRIHHNLGGDEKFVCPNRNCGLVIHRDINGARNMLLMNLAVLREVLVSMRDAETRQVAAGILSGMRNDTRCAAWHWELMDNENP